MKHENSPLIRQRIIDAAWLRFQREVDLAVRKGNGHGHWTRSDVERKVDYALRPDRQARIRPSKAKGFWTLARKLAFKMVVDADHRLNPSDRKVAWAMLEAVRDERGLSYLASKSLARQTQVHEVTARACRLKLIALNYFVLIKRGGKNKPTVCTPNRALVRDVKGLNPAMFFSVHPPFSTASPANDVRWDQGIEPAWKKGASVASETTEILTIEGGSYQASEGAKAESATCGGEQTEMFGVSMSDPLAFGRWVRQQRLALGMSQMSMASKLGCTQPHLANVERGHDKLGEWRRRRLVELLKGAA
jgi:hypothetical protein